MADHQGVLYKRRDIFTRQWRPRWFVLQSQSGILTYYLFSGNEPTAILVGSSTPMTMQSSSSLHGLTNAATTTTSLDDSSSVIQHDIIPRGTIFLRGCQVRVANEWSRPNESIYCFVVSAPDSNATPCCLATTTAHERDEWVRKIRAVCSGNEIENDDNADQQEEIMDDTEEESVVAALPELDTTRPAESSCAWAAAEPGVATAGLEQVMKVRIDALLEKYLPYTNDGPEWTILNESKDGVTSYLRDGKMIKSVAILDHHPKQIFNLVADIKRRKNYDKNIRCGERVKRFNAHTTFDYYAYQPVWPTTAREFLALFHWRVVKRRQNEEAIAFIGFSYPEGNDLRPPTDDHIRADLEVSLFLLELCDGNKTKATRIVSYDLCGNIPRSLTNHIMQQQGTMPLVISDHLKANEPLPPHQLSEGDISDSILASEIIDRIIDVSDPLDSVRRRLQLDSSMSSAVENDEPTAVDDSVEEEELDEQEDISKPSTLLIALILMTPLVLYNLIDGRMKEVTFLVSAFLAVRTVVKLNLGPQLPEHDYADVVTCRLTVNLRGFFHFLAKAKEDNAEAHQDGPQPSVLPFVVKAVVKAMECTDGLNCKSISIPVLRVRGCFLRKDAAVSVLCATDARDERIVTLPNVCNASIESIVLEIETGVGSRAWETSRSWSKALHVLLHSLGFDGGDASGSCLVVMRPDSDGYEIDFGVTPSSKFNVIVQVGGLRLSKHSFPKRVSTHTPTHPMTPPAPTLAITVSVKCPTNSISECRRFAELVQTYVH